MPGVGLVDVAIIGGTGVGSRLAALPGSAIHVPTRFGLLRGRVVSHEGIRILAVQRHSAQHRTPPHAIAYKAIVQGLAQIGPKAVMSTAAVGSLRDEWMPGTFAVCSDLLDFTARRLTMFSDTVVHTDCTHPFDPMVRSALLESAQELGVGAQPEAVYVCGDGPRYETAHEIQTIKMLGGDLAGMTAATEALLCREAGLKYACLAIVTNLAAGISETELTHEEVTECMQVSGETAVRILLAAAKRIAGK